MVGQITQIAKIEYDGTNLERWLRKLEIRMETHGVGSQWTKRLCLESALPPNLAGDLNSLFDKRKVAAGDNIYYECKTLLLRIHGAQPDDDFKLALNLQMIGKPSQTAQKMVALVCKQDPPMQSCCCATAVSTIWRALLPTEVQQAIATMDLKTEYSAVLNTADAVWRTLQAPKEPITKIAAVTSDVEAEPAEVAALKQKGAARGRGVPWRRGGRGQIPATRGRGGLRPPPQRRPTAHPDGPPENACTIHWNYGKSAFFCLDSTNCPWRSFITPRRS